MLAVAGIRFLGIDFIVRTQMDGFHDFMSTLKSMNRSVKIPGC